MSCPPSLLPVFLSKNLVRWCGLQTCSQVRLPPLETSNSYQHHRQHHHKDNGHRLVAAKLGAAWCLGLLDAGFVSDLGGKFLRQTLVLGAGGPSCLHASTHSSRVELRADLHSTRAGTRWIKGSSYDERRWQELNDGAVGANLHNRSGTMRIKGSSQ